MGAIIASPYTHTFWNEYVLNPRSCEYNLVLDQTIEGALDVDRLRAAVDGVCRDYILFHHVLDDSSPQLRWVKTEKKIALETLDADCDVGKLINTPFDLREGPLCRFYLIELAPQRYNLIIVVHHILIDGLSGQEFYNAVSAYYNRGAAVAPPQADETDICRLYRRYEADIAALKQDFASASFWGDRLAECAPRVALPYLPGEVPEAPGAGEVRFTLPFAEWQALKSGVRYANPFLIFKTLWALLIARQSAQDTVHIGYPVAPDGGEPLFFGAQVNTAVFPLTLAPEATFNQLYRATLAYSKALKATGKLRHSQLPVYDMLNLSPVRELNVNFTQAYLKDAPLALDGCRIGVNHRYNVDLAGSELLLEYQPTEQAFEFRLRYRPDLFDATQMAEMAEQYLGLLQRALTEPDAPIAAWPQLTAQQVLRCRDVWESEPDTADPGATPVSYIHLAWGTAPLAGVFAAFYTSQDDVKTVVKTLIWLNAAFMPIWAASWVLPAGLKGARDARFAMWVTMLGMWGCRVVAGYALGIELGMGVVGVWLGMFLDWAVRGALFYWRMVSGRWLWKYPRAKRREAG